MVYVKAVDGSCYLISRESIAFIQSHGDKTFIHLSFSNKIIVSTTSVEQWRIELNIDNSDNKNLSQKELPYM